MQRPQNAVLARLPKADLDLIAPALEACELVPGHRLDIASSPIEHIYFPESGIASVVAIDPNGRRIEIGPVGRESMSGLPVVLGARKSQQETVVQVVGTGHRISADVLEQAIAESRSLHLYLLRYVSAFTAQTSQTLMVNSYAGLEQRLARWLLMAHDRVDGDELAITHGYMSEMLSVRRPGVTEAIHAIEGRGLVKAMRGLVRVIDRQGLEELAGWTYGASEAEYKRLIVT